MELRVGELLAVFGVEALEGVHGLGYETSTSPSISLRWTARCRDLGVSNLGLFTHKHFFLEISIEHQESGTGRCLHLPSSFLELPFPSSHAFDGQS